MTGPTTTFPGGRGTAVAFVGAALVLCGVFLATDGVVRGVAFTAATALPASIILGILGFRRPPAPLPWWFAFGALVSMTVGSVSWLAQVGIGGAARATGIVPMVFIPAGYLGLFVASALVVLPIARRDGGAIIDAVIGSLAGAGLLWAFVVVPTLDDRNALPPERASALLTLLLLCGVTGAIARALLMTVRARPPLGYLLLAASVSVVGNVANILTADTRTGAAADWIGTLWIVGYLATAAAVLHPASAHLATPGRMPVRRLSAAHLAFLWVALSLNPAVAAARELAGHATDVLLQSTVSLLIAPLILVRVWRFASLYENTRSRLVHEATHDALTGLPNRRAAADHLDRVLREVESGRSVGAQVCFLDLDDFKAVNDELGHTAGDELLVEVADRLLAAVRHDDFVGRFGGDEFLLVLADRDDEEEDGAASTVTRIRSALDEPVALLRTAEGAGAVVPRVGVSIGAVTVRRGAGTSSSRLLSLADARMYQDKRRPGRAAPAAGPRVPNPPAPRPQVGRRTTDE